jgi:hypothetical protein
VRHDIGHIDEFRIAHVQRSDGWIETTWNNMSDPGAFTVAGTEEEGWRESLVQTALGVHGLRTSAVAVTAAGDGASTKGDGFSNEVLEEAAYVPFFGAFGAASRTTPWSPAGLVSRWLGGAAFFGKRGAPRRTPPRRRRAEPTVPEPSADDLRRRRRPFPTSACLPPDERPSRDCLDEPVGTSILPPGTISA